MAQTSESWRHADAKGQAYLSTFPFFFLVNDTVECPVVERRYKQATVRIYPFFRSGGANFTGAPNIDPSKVPFTMPVRHNGRELFTTNVFPTYAQEDSRRLSVSLSHRDSLRVDILSNKDENFETKVAREIVDKFCAHLRIITRQWWIGNPYVVFAGHLRNVFSIDQKGMALSEPYGTGQVRTFGGFERAIDPASFVKASNLAVDEIPTDLVDETILDGVYEEARGRSRHAVLAYSVALEMEKDRTIERLWSRQNVGSKFRKGKIASGNDLADHLDRVIKVLCGRSLREENEQLWNKARNLWLLRNEVAHGRLTEDQVIAARLADLHPTVETMDQLIEWLRSA